MHTATDPARLPLAPRTLARGCAVTIGNFDGVHLGHQALIGKTVQKARAGGLPAVVITFDPHPLRVMLGTAAPPQLITLRHKLECFADLGVNLALVIPFTRKLAAQAPESFVDRVLVEQLRTRDLVVGYDYAFGRGRRGNVALLSALGAAHGFTVEQLDAVYVQGAIVSSTRIRESLQAGDVGDARDLLGRPHCVEGTVAHGMNRGGRLLGFPTANLNAEEGLMLPKAGVYAVWAETGASTSRGTGKSGPLPLGCAGSCGPLLRGVANVGSNPTFGDDFLRVETHLLDFHADIYDSCLRVHFIQYLRDEQKFDSVGALVEQIRRDCDHAREILIEENTEGALPPQTPPAGA